MYEKYKPVRNLMRGFNIAASLELIWQLSQHLMIGSRPPFMHGVPPGPLSKLILPYQLNLLCREILLNGTTAPGTRALANWKDISAALRAILDYAELASTITQENFLLELHRVGQQQLPLQRRPSVSRFMRYIQLYENAEVSAILERVVGMPARDYSFLGFMTFTQVSKAAGFVTNPDLEMLGISTTSRDRFFERMTGSLSVIRTALQENQRFDHTWQYTFDPLDDRPLINLDASHPERVYCPMPERSLTRFTEGTFYLLFRERGFDNAFGKAFEAYIGNVIRKACASSRIAVHNEEPFVVNGNVNHGVDFVLSDGTAHVFVECKTKRLNLQGRMATTAEDLDAQLAVLAQAVVQNYRNIKLALDGRTHWVADSLPSVNLVVTLEDWHLISPDSHSVLIRKIQELLAMKSLDGMFDQVPFAILPAEKFEKFCCAINDAGTKPVVSPLFEKERTAWSLAAHLDRGFADAARASGQLFMDDFEEYGRQITQPKLYATRHERDVGI